AIEARLGDRGALAGEQLAAAAGVADEVEAAVGHGSIQVGEIEGAGGAAPLMEIDEQAVDDFLGVVGAAEVAPGLAEAGGPVLLVTGAVVTGRSHRRGAWGRSCRGASRRQRRTGGRRRSNRGGRRRPRRRRWRSWRRGRRSRR